MRKSVAVLLGLYALILACTPFLTGSAPELTPEQYALDYVCDDLLEMDLQKWGMEPYIAEMVCSSIDPPRVRYADLSGLIQAHGYYWYERDANTVWLDLKYEQDAWNWFAVAVLIHETTHYVHRHIKGNVMSCETEALAFEVEHSYLYEIVHPEEVWETWYLSYGCPRP